MLCLKGWWGRVRLAPLTDGHTSKRTNIHKRATHVDTQEEYKHTGVRTGTHTHTHNLGVIHSLLGSRANFKGVSIFRPEQLDPSEMDQAHQSPRLCLVP